MFENTFNSIDRLLRNDEGLASELDYAEQTSWVLFLKYLDDLEAEREDTALLDGQDYLPILHEPYRWQTWAAPKKDGKLDHNAARTGSDLVGFVNAELFPYLRKFRDSGADPDALEYKIGEIFSEIVNKFRSGYTLRDVLEVVDGLHFNSQTAKHELSHLYETRIKRMGNAGRNGGEYYTPRPLIRAMIKVTDPKIGETSTTAPAAPRASSARPGSTFAATTSPPPSGTRFSGGPSTGRRRSRSPTSSAS